MVRNGKQDNGYGVIDALTFCHSGNQLIHVGDNASRSYIVTSNKFGS